MILLTLFLKVVKPKETERTKMYWCIMGIMEIDNVIYLITFIKKKYYYPIQVSKSVKTFWKLDACKICGLNVRNPAQIRIMPLMCYLVLWIIQLHETRNMLWILVILINRRFFEYTSRTRRHSTTLWR